MVLPYKPIGFIHIEGYGLLSAQVACEEFKIKSQHDKELLRQAKEKVYKLGFYEGILKVGKYAEMKVAQAKPLVRAEMIQAGEAASYYEPESLVISRSGDECIVALCDQWYIRYDDVNWKQQVMKHLQTNFKTFSETSQKELEFTVNWLNQWGCSRSYGLGTRLPFDK